MLKKMIIGLVFITAMGVLIVGGINRTVAKTSDVYDSEVAAGRGRLSQSAHLSENQQLSSVAGRSEANVGSGRYIESGGTQNQTAVYQGGNGQGRQRGGREKEEAGGGALNLAAEAFTDLVELEGTISNVDMTGEVLIATNDGEIILEGRALSFAISQGFTAQVGDEVLVEGFFEDAEFEIVQITNQTNGLVTALRGPTGRPLWAGGGRDW